MVRSGGVLAGLLYGGLAVAQVANITPIAVPGAASVNVTALNRHGHVTGYFSDAQGAQRPFFWDGTTAVDQGTLGGSGALGFDLNDLDQTTGYSFAVGDTSFLAYLGIGRSLFSLGTLGGLYSLGQGINNAGEVTGYSFVSPQTVEFHAFVSRGGVMTDLGTLGGSMGAGYDINEAGQVTGDSTVAGDSENHAFFFDGTNMRDIGTLGGTYSSASRLNNLGQVTGYSSTADDAEFLAFLYDNGVLRSLGSLGGTFSLGYVINDGGVVAGDSSLAGDEIVQGFVWSGGVMTSVGHLGSQFSSVWGLNNSNAVVGVSTNAQGLSRAFLWRNGALVDLNSTLRPDAGWVLEGAYFINDAGQIVGTGRYQGQPSWYRLELQAENQPPVARAGGDASLECGGAAVVDGSGSSDPDGDALAFAWFEGDRLLGETAQLSVLLEPGVHTLRLRVTDAHGASAVDEVVVTVVDSTPPELAAPGSITRAAGPTCGAEVPGLLGEVQVSDQCTPLERLVVTQDPAPGTVVGLGDHAVTVRAVDAAGNVAEKVVKLRVVDQTPPAIRSVTATPEVISPANKQMVPVNLAVVVEDACDPSPVSRILRVESSDAVTGPGDKTSPDWNITGDLTLEVRAEVSVQDVRVYTVVVGSTDRAGNSATSTVQVVVKKNKNSAVSSLAAASLKSSAKRKK